ncbi:hypothetical protein D3C73_1248310 [compost metagenome]
MASAALLMFCLNSLRRLNRIAARVITAILPLYSLLYLIVLKGSFLDHKPWLDKGFNKMVQLSMLKRLNHFITSELL